MPNSVVKARQTPIDFARSRTNMHACTHTLPPFYQRIMWLARQRGSLSCLTYCYVYSCGSSSCRRSHNNSNSDRRRCCCWAVYRRRSFRSLAKHLIVTRLCPKSYVFHMHSHYSYYVSTHTQRCYFKKKCLTFILFLLWLSLLIFLIELCAKNNRFYKRRIDELILLLVVVVAASPAVYCGSWCDWV